VRFLKGVTVVKARVQLRRKRRLQQNLQELQMQYSCVNDAAHGEHRRKPVERVNAA
jgi:hypothetical protein